MEENYIAQDEEEISLIDLFAVLVRYRKFIIIFTAVVTVLAGLYLFVLPKVVKSFDKKGVIVTFAVTAKEPPAKNLSVTFPSIAATGRYFMGDPQTLALVHKQYPAFTDAATKIDGEYAYNAFIQNLIKTKKIAVETSPLSQHFSLTLTVAEDKIDTAVSMAYCMVDTINAMIDESVVPQLETTLEQTEASLETMKGSTNALTALSYQEMISLKQTLSELIKSKNFHLSIAKTPFVVNEAQGRAKKLIIVFFAAFFIAVFGAFALNAVENIKKDPDASKTIQDAWKAGK